MKIGFVGLGAMGLRMARHLVHAGHEVRGFDMRAEAVEALAGAGGVPADDAAAAASGADLLILMVVNGAQAEAVLFDQGALDALPRAGAVVLMATCAPAVARSIASRVEAAGRAFADAPVSGGTAGAEAASLSIMLSCDDALHDRLAPVLRTMGGKLFHVGREPGQGAAMKVLNQLLCGIHIASAAEALSLADRMGIDRRVALDILGGSAAASWMLNDRGPRMLEPHPVVSSAVDIFVKDLGLVLDAGRDGRAALPLAAAAHQMFLAASGRGEGALDDSQVIRSYLALAGTPAGSD